MSKQKQSILYKILKQGEDKGYLLGTMHVRDKRAFTFLRTIETAMDQCDVFYAETNIHEMASVDTSRMMHFIDPERLSDHLSEKRWLKYQKICRRAFNIELSQLDQMKPMAVLQVFMMHLLSSDMPIALDHHLWNYGEEHDMTLRGLETIDEQAQIFRSIPLRWQFKQLRDTMRNISTFRNDINKLAETYQRGDIQKLYRSAKKQLGGMRSLMLYDRNTIMAERAAQALASERCFISAGAAHLPGKKGMVRLLKNEGFKLIPIIK